MKKNKIILSICTLTAALTIAAPLTACQNKKITLPATSTSQSETITATPSPVTSAQEKKTDKNQQTVVNEDGEVAVLFPEETQSGTKTQNSASSTNQTDNKTSQNTSDPSNKKDSDSKKEETNKKEDTNKKDDTNQKPDTDTKKDPEKEPDQKDPELTEDRLSELPMVPYED